METLEQFDARVFSLTGKHLNDLPRLVVTSGTIPHIIARRGNIRVCAEVVEDKDGNLVVDGEYVMIIT